MIVETVWMLESAYGYPVGDVVAAFQSLLLTPVMQLQDSEFVWSALRSYRGGADFADALIAEMNVDAGCQATITFDRKAVKRSDHFRLIG